MIKSVTVTNHLGESLVLELTRPDLSGFIVKEIDGLGPVKANINTTKRATADGTAYNSAYLNQRDITFQLQFYTTGAESIEDIRHRSYKYFPLKKQVTIRVETDNRISETTGYVEANEPNIFSNAEGCTVVVACPDPYFYSLHTSETIFSGIEPAFEFPLINDSSTESLIELGVVKNNEEENVYYTGDSEVGLKINIHALGEASNVTIYNLNSRDSMSLDTSKFPTTLKSNVFEDSGIVWTRNAYMRHDGTLITSSGYPDSSMVSDYIAVTTGTSIDYTQLFMNQIGSAGVVLYFYDENKVLSSDTTVNPSSYNGTFWDGTFKIPNGIFYMRLSITDNEGSSLIYQKPIDPYIRQGDTITINTTLGNKSVELYRQGETYNIINCLGKNMNWFTLSKGDNLFAYRAEKGNEYLQFRIENKIRYNGV